MLIRQRHDSIEKIVPLIVQTSKLPLVYVGHFHFGISNLQPFLYKLFFIFFLHQPLLGLLLFQHNFRNSSLWCLVSYPYVFCGWFSFQIFLRLFDATFIFANEIGKVQATVCIGQIKVHMTLYNVGFVVDHFNFSSGKTKDINHVLCKQFLRIFLQISTFFY